MEVRTPIERHSGEINRDQALMPGGAFATGQEDQRKFRARVDWGDDFNERLRGADWNPPDISIFYELRSVS